MQKFLFPAVNEENLNSNQLALIKLRGKGHIDNHPRVNFSEEHLRTLAAAEIREKIDIFIQDYCDVSDTTYSFWKPTGSGHERSRRIVEYSGFSCTLSYYMMILSDLLDNRLKPVNHYPVMIFTGDIVGDYNTLKKNDIFRIYDVQQINQKAALVLSELATGNKPYIINKDEIYLNRENTFLFCFKDKDGEFNLGQVLEKISSRLEHCSARIEYIGNETGIIFEHGMLRDTRTFHPVTSGRQYHFSLNIEVPQQKRNFKITFFRADNVKQILSHIYGPGWETAQAGIDKGADVFINNKDARGWPSPVKKIINGFNSSPVYKPLTASVILLLITVLIISYFINYRTKDNPQLLYKRGLIEFNQGKYNDSLVDCEQALKINPLFAEAYCLRGKIHLKNNNLNAASMDCEQALKINPLFAEAYCLRGKIHLKNNNLNAASMDCGQALKINPIYAEAYYLRGKIHLKNNNLNAASMDCEQALKLNPDLWEAYELRSDCYMIENDQENALKYINKAIKIEQKSAVLYNKRGLIYYQLEKYNLAEKEFATAIRINDNYKEAYINLGYTLEKQQGKEAIAGFQDGQRNALDLSDKKVYIREWESTGSTEKIRSPFGSDAGSNNAYKDREIIGTTNDIENEPVVSRKFYDKSSISSQYIGYYKAGKRVGQGSLFEYNRKGCLVKKYLGQFKNDALSGEGILITYDDNQNMLSKYIGHVTDGKASGEGTMFLYNKSGVVISKNTGRFTDNMMNGEALSITYNANGEVLNSIYGFWVNNKLSNSSLKVSDAGDHYSGNWLNGEKHGFGIYSWDKNSELAGAVYIGNFEHDMKSKSGALILPSGDKYVGNFKEDILHGSGTWYFSDGSRSFVRYNEGKIADNGIKIWPDGTRYTTTIDSLYHTEKNRHMPGSVVNTYKTKKSGNKSMNGFSAFKWAPSVGKDDN